MASSSFLSTTKASDSSLRVHLHPLILLTISDYITRHTLRGFTTPIVGALLGQQNGRDITLEHAFEAEVIDSNEQILLHETWFKDRVQQYKDVHQAPALELLGWFTTAPTTGPESVHVAIHQQILHTHNETAVLLAFHPASVLEGAAVGGKLPLTIYESVYESGENEDRSMEIDGQDARLGLKFKELSYSVETGEAEMISVDFVARGGGNATAVDGTAKKEGKEQASQKPVGQVDEKGKAVQKDTKETKVVDDSLILSAEDEERKSSANPEILLTDTNEYSHRLSHRPRQRSQDAPRPHLPPQILPPLAPAVLPNNSRPFINSHNPTANRHLHLNPRNQPPSPPLHPRPPLAPAPPPPTGPPIKIQPINPRRKIRRGTRLAAWLNGPKCQRSARDGEEVWYCRRDTLAGQEGICEYGFFGGCVAR